MLKQDNNVNIRLISAAIISTILIFFWGKFIKKDVKPRVVEQKKVEQLQIEKIEEAANAESVIVPQNVQVFEEKIISIDTENLSGSINLRGLKVDNLILKKYNRDLNSDEKVQLLYPKNNNNSFYIDFGWFSDDKSIDLPNETTLWKTSSETITANNPVILSYKNKQNIEFQFIITLDDEYMFNFEQRIINNSDKTFAVKLDNKLYKRTNAEDEKRAAGVHEGLIGSFKKQIEEIKYKKLKKNNYNFDSFNWAGFTNKYWLVSLIAEQDKTNLFNVKTSHDNGLHKIEFQSTSDIVAPNQTVGGNTKVFAGPKILDLLDSYSVKYNLPLFDRAVDFGWFYFLTKPIYIILKVFYNFVGNFGVAIILLTLLVKLIMYPFTKKSFISMSKMKIVQPKMDQLKEKYGSDKMRLNKELVDLYKKEGINPLSGCLPMLVQIPVFFSLYKVLVISIDMRQAPFIGYIKNLAEKDPTTIWNLFGLLPYNVNFFPLGFLPILMSFTMWLQQKLSGQNGMNRETQTATKVMPIMFLLIFAGMPTGLLLYWTFSNILTILQQVYIEYKMNKSKTVNGKVIKMK